MSGGKRSEKLASIFFILLTTVFLLPSLSITNSAEAIEKNVTIAFQGPLTGEESSVGQQQLAAVKYAVGIFNRRFNGTYKVSVALLDDRGDPTVAAEFAPGVASNEKILGLVGPSYSGATIASLSSYKARNLPMISPSATRISLTDPATGNIGFPVFHRLAPTDKVQGPALFKLAIKGVSSPKTFIVDDQSAYGVGLRDYMKPTIPASQSVGFESVSDKTTNWSTTISRVKTTGANVVIFTGYFPQAAQFFKQLRDSGYTGILAGGDGVLSPSFLSLAPASVLEGVRLTAGTVPLGEISRSLEADFKDEMGEASGIYAAESIDATNVFLFCIAKGVSTRKEMLECIDGYSGTSVYGYNIEFDRNGDNSNAQVSTFEVRRGVIQYMDSLGRSTQTANQIKQSFKWYNVATNSSTTTIEKPSTPAFSAVNFVGNKINIKVNIGSSASSRPDKVYLVAPKLGISAANPLAGVISGSSATWSVNFDELLAGTMIPLEVVGEKSGVKSNSVTSSYQAPALLSEAVNIPATPKNYTQRIVGTSALITVQTTIKAGAIPTNAFLFSKDLGISKSNALEGEVLASKAVFEVPIKASMAGRKYVVAMYFSNGKGESKPLRGTLLIPNAPKAPTVPNTTIKPPKAQKTVVCNRAQQARVFIGNTCPPGWKKN